MRWFLSTSMNTRNRFRPTIEVLENRLALNGQFLGTHNCSLCGDGQEQVQMEQFDGENTCSLSGNAGAEKGIVIVDNKTGPQRRFKAHRDARNEQGNIVDDMRPASNSAYGLAAKGIIIVDNIPAPQRFRPAFEALEDRLALNGQFPGALDGSGNPARDQFERLDEKGFVFNNKPEPQKIFNAGTEINRERPYQWIVMTYNPRIHPFPG